MMITNFTRDKSYFRSLSENNSVISYKDFDLEFNNLINYLNKECVNNINLIIEQSYTGVRDNINYVLKNIGNGKIVFSKLENINYTNNSIELIKLNLITSNSLLYTKKNTNIAFLKLNNDNFGIGGIFKNVYSYDYTLSNMISGVNFEDKAIKSENIDSSAITRNHISQDGISYLLTNLLVQTNNIISISVPNIKFDLYQITADKLHHKILQLRRNSGLVYKINSITSDKIKDNSFNFNLILNNRDKFGDGLLHKNTIPLNSIILTAPTIEYPETINPYLLCIYSVKKAYKIVKHEEPIPDQVYKNPKLISLNKQLKKVQKKIAQNQAVYNKLVKDAVLTDYRGVKLNYISMLESYITTTVEYFFNITAKVPQKLFQNNNNVRFENYRTSFIKYNNSQPLLINQEATLLNEINKTPINIYVQQPPRKYETIEEVLNTVTYSLKEKQNVIKSYHLGGTMFNINNFLDRITCPNVKSKNFIDKNSLDDNLRTLLGLN